MGLNNRDISVYILLFVSKWIVKQEPQSSSKIYKTLNSIKGFFPGEHRIAYSEKSISVSLETLVAMGFVSRCDNTAKARSGGRPATTLYTPNNITTVQKKIENTLAEYKKNILLAISPLSALEEGIALQDNGETQ